MLSPLFGVCVQEEDEENLYTSIQRLRDRTSELSSKVSLLERLGSGDLSYQQSAEELRAAQDQLGQMVEARNHRLAPLTHARARTCSYLDAGHQDPDTLGLFCSSRLMEKKRREKLRQQASAKRS